MTASRLSDRHVVVTGASSGIGRAIALRLAGEGARVSLVARRVEQLEGVAAEVRAAGGQAAVCPCDITDSAAVDVAFDSAVAAFGPIHGLVAASGIGGPNSVPRDPSGPGDRFDTIVQTNLYGTYHCLRATEARLAPGPDARHIVVIASVLARFGVPGYTAYCASKAALLGLVRASAMELAGQNVQVNAICPGWVDTEMAWEGIDGMAAAMGVTRQKAHDIAMRAVPLGRMGQPEHVAGMVAWLLTPDATGVTGQTLDINGGAWM
ncbi:MAG: SDR family NAD(P)-dependent oxidoreductase [Pseudomonadota bacterium]|nr:SDR family NAD(P)-dependent oxidoreductase [Pseudomonadota bacterium]